MGKMEGNFNITFLIDNILKCFPDEKLDLKASIKVSVKKNILKQSLLNFDNNRVKNDNNNNSNNNNNNNKNNKKKEINYDDEFLGSSVEFNKFIESLEKK